MLLSGLPTDPVVLHEDHEACGRNLPDPHLVFDELLCFGVPLGQGGDVDTGVAKGLGYYVATETPIQKEPRGFR